MLTGAGSRTGFTLVEVVVALVILSTAVLGLAASASSLSTTAQTAELRALALESAEDRIAAVRLDPRYDALDSLYTAEEPDVLGEAVPGYTRTTTVTHVTKSSPALDYMRVSVVVSGPLLIPSVTRQIVVAAP